MCAFRYYAFTPEINPVKGVDRHVAIGLDTQVFIRLNKILRIGGRQTASWVQELTAHMLEELLGEESNPSAPSAAGVGEVAAAQPPRPPTLCKNSKPSCKRARSSATGSVLGNRLRADFVLPYKPESSAVGCRLLPQLSAHLEHQLMAQSVASTTSFKYPSFGGQPWGDSTKCSALGGPPGSRMVIGR